MITVTYRTNRYSILPAISLTGVLALEVREESYTAETFSVFISRLLDRMNPFPQRNSVLVMDNASIHHSAAMQDMIETRHVLHNIPHTILVLMILIGGYVLYSCPHIHQISIQLRRLSLASSLPSEKIAIIFLVN
jgi:hypothetical protein